MFDAVYELGGGPAYTVQSGFEFGQVLAAAPGSDIGKGIFRSVYPEVLAYDIGDALGLYFNGSFIFFLRSGQFSIHHRERVELCMGSFVYGGLDGLDLAHALIDVDALIQMVIILYVSYIRLI